MKNALIPIVVDIVTVLILLAFTLRGRRRGLIKTLAGIIALVISFTGAGYLSNLTTPYISSQFVEPHINAAITPESEQAPDGGVSDSNALGSVFLKLGIQENIVTEAASDFSSELGDNIADLADSFSENVAYKVTYAISFLVYFIILMLLLSLIFKFLNLASKIPGINFVNKTLGLLLGLILGYLFVIAVSFILKELGLILSDELISRTYVLKFVTTFNPLSFVNGV